MLVKDVIKRRLKTYAVKLRLQNKGATTILDTTVQASNPQMARIILKQQYGNSHVIVGQPRELR